MPSSSRGHGHEESQGSEAESSAGEGSAEAAECTSCGAPLVDGSCPDCGQKAGPHDPAGFPAGAAGAIGNFLQGLVGRDLSSVDLIGTDGKSPPVGMILFILNVVVLVVVVVLSLLFPGLF